MWTSAREGKVVSALTVVFQRRVMLKSMRRLIENRFFGSAKYWEHRYASGGTSGHGSYGEYAFFKAEFLNRFVFDHGIKSVVEFGCGDGNQLSLANYPSYMGIDISPTAIKRCSERFRDDKSKKFFLAGQQSAGEAELAISLDVTFHLIEDEVFSRYMSDLFRAARRFVIIYSSDPDVNSRPQPHVLHRPISRYVAENFQNWQKESCTDNPFPEHPTDNFAKFLVFSFQR
jgi:hypothetical protein